MFSKYFLSIKKLFMYLILSIVFILVFKSPLEIILIEMIINNIKYTAFKEGRIDIPLFINYPEAKNGQKYLASIYKSDAKKLVELEKENTIGESWLSCDNNLSVHLSQNKHKIMASAKSIKDGLFIIISNSSSLIELNELKNSNDKTLLIFTKNDYYHSNFKNVIGISFALCCLVFISVSGYFLNKKIDDTPVKKKTIIYLPN